MSSVLLWAGVCLLGGVGALARFGVDSLVSSRALSRFPLGTLAVNLTGACILGVLAGAAVGHDEYLLAGTAVIGSYTTFSTWQLESHRLAEDGLRRAAVLNLLLSLALGLGAVACGRAIGGLL
jgi:CrcB protein